MKIGLFSTFIEQDAETLVTAVKDRVRSGEIPDSEIAFIFSNRETEEDPVTDGILTKLSEDPIPLVTFSAAKFKPLFREAALRRWKNNNNPALINDWRNEYGVEVMRRLPQTDIDFLLGDMYIWGTNMCEARNGVNLHPALPDGPKGTWQNVIKRLIKKGESETGVMMHKVTPVLDRGPAVTYCRFPIRGRQFDLLWEQLPQDEEELVDHALFRKIREEGFRRETPLVIQTARAFAEGRVRVEGDLIVDGSGQILQEGYDLTSQIEQMIKPNLEGQTARKEVRS